MADRITSNEEFLDLLARHEGQIFGFLLALIRHREDAEDVMQQVVVTMWQKFGDFQSGSDFAAWGCAIARNRALNYFQSGHRRTMFSQTFVDLLEDIRVSQPCSVRVARLQALRGCLDKLAAEDRRLILDRYKQGAEVRRMAEELGRSAASVSNSLRRIRQALYRCIDSSLAQEGRA